MVLVAILIAAGVTALSHVAPFRFLLDLANDDVAVAYAALSPEDVLPDIRRWSES